MRNECRYTVLCELVHCYSLLLLLLSVVHTYMCVYVWTSSCESIDLSSVVVRSFVCLSPVFSSHRLLHRDTLLLPQFHRVFFVFLVYNTYLDHVILIDVHIVIKNDVGKVIRIIAPKYIDWFSLMKPVLSLWS